MLAQLEAQPVLKQMIIDVQAQADLAYDEEPKAILA